MPLYEYHCDDCGKTFERIQKFSDPILSVCPTCGGAVRKLISSPAIQFKGSGFYINDYAKSDKQSGKSSSRDGGSDSKDSKESGKSDKSESSADKSDKSDKSQKSEKSEKSDSSSSAAPAPSSSTSPKADAPKSSGDSSK